MDSKSKLVSVALAASLLAACASSRPVVYPDPYLGSGAQETVDADIEQCQDFAVDDRPGMLGVPAETLTTAAVALLRGVVSMVMTGDVAGQAESIANSGAYGLAELVSESSAEAPARRAVVEQCLKDKGYTQIGWR